MQIRLSKLTSQPLVFTNPKIPYSWEGNHEATVSHFCVFTKEFLQENGRMHNLEDSSLFKPGGDLIYFLTDQQADHLTNIFAKMKLEQEGDYVHKNDLIRSYLNLIIHEAIKMQPASAYFIPQKASSRIAKLFLDLLERQFPVDSQQYTLILKKASDYADQLAVHVNHLNAAVREVTGRSTTTHINNRILSEARSLLIHTDWNVAEIARSLGFDYASYFNNFFKKHTGLTPMALRKTL